MICMLECVILVQYDELEMYKNDNSRFQFKFQEKGRRAKKKTE